MLVCASKKEPKFFNIKNNKLNHTLLDATISIPLSLANKGLIRLEWFILHW